MLTKKQKSYLRSEANKLSSKYQVGKNNINDNVIKMIDEGLTAHELVKVELLKTVETKPDAAALILSEELHCDVVQVIGRVITLFRANKDHPIYKINKL